MIIDGENEVEKPVTAEIPEEIPEEGLEIELPDDDALSTSESEAAEVAKAAAEKAKPERRSGTARKRINELTRKHHEAEERLVQAETYAQKLQRENEELRLGKKQSEAVAVENYAGKVTAQYERALQALEDAISTGDPKQIALANGALAPLASEKANAENYLARQKAEAERTPKPAEREPEQRQEQPRLSPEIQSFVSETPWFDTSSDDYDEDMHKAAVSYAQILEAKYRRTGKTAEIGKSPAYFKAIRDYVENEFEYGEEVEDVPPAKPGKPPMRAGNADVAPATRTSATQAASPNVVRLTPIQVSHVKDLVMAGAIPNPKTGKAATMQEALVIWAAEQRKIEAEDRANQAAKAL